MADYTYRDDQDEFFTPFDVELNPSGGPSYGTWRSEEIDFIVTDSTNQLHPFAQNGNDTLNLIFENITGTVEGGIAHGHHARGDDTGGTRSFSDTFNFQDVNEVSGDGTVVGRLEDFDSSRDLITIEGIPLLGTDGNGNYVDNIDSFATNNPGLVASVEVVLYNGQHNDTYLDANGNVIVPEMQQWLLIETATGGTIFYALEGARIDMDGNGGSAGGSQESHFITELPSDFSTLPRVDYVDNHHYVPADAGFEAHYNIINDEDKEPSHVNAEINGTSDDDAIAAGLNDDIVNAGAGDDYVWGGSGHDMIYGEDGHDRIWGDSGDDFINGGGGDDIIFGGRGNDGVRGGNGADTVYLGEGNDVFRDNAQGGAYGKDTVYGEDGDDFIEFIGGDNEGYGGAGNDELRGGSGVDTLNGDDGNDIINGGAGGDTIHGGNGDDLVWGDNGADTVYLGNGNDVFTDNAQGGAYGSDTVQGGGGDDTIILRGGNDKATGGSGSDTFIFKGTYEDDIITDFEVGQAGDVIDLTAISSITSFNDLMEYHIADRFDANGDFLGAMIGDWSGNTILLEGVYVDELSSDNFVF